MDRVPVLLLAAVCVVAGVGLHRAQDRQKRRRPAAGSCAPGSERDWHKRLWVAVKLARRAGQQMRQAQKAAEGGGVQVEHKGRHDLVTATDKAIEELIRAELARKFPDDAFIGEESCAAEGRTPQLPRGCAWIVDPIDATTNFVHGLPITCVSVGLVVDGRPQLGVIYNPFTDELYHAVSGHGAYRNGRRIRCSGQTSLRDSVVVTEYSCVREERQVQRMMATTAAILAQCRAVRHTGCGALDLCYLAAGAVDVVYGGVEGVWKPWDWAAGVVICQEAGAVLLCGSGGVFDLMGSTLLAAATPALAASIVNCTALPSP